MALGFCGVKEAITWDLVGLDRKYLLQVNLETIVDEGVPAVENRIAHTSGCVAHNAEG
jgi:hypothetical protein